MKRHGVSLQTRHIPAVSISVTTFSNRISIICNQIDVIMLNGICRSPIPLTAEPVRR